MCNLQAVINDNLEKAIALRNELERYSDSYKVVIGRKPIIIQKSIITLDDMIDDLRGMNKITEGGTSDNSRKKDQGSIQ